MRRLVAAGLTVTIAPTLALLAGCHGAGRSSVGTDRPRTSPASAGVAGTSTRASATDRASSASGPSTGVSSASTGTAPTVGASAGPTKAPDETIVGTPSSVTLEALLPVAPGKQRWTDQTFVITGDRADQLVHELKEAPVYTGPAPAGCQPDGQRISIRLSSGGRQLTFVSYCDLIWVGQTGGRSLRSFTVVKDVEDTVASLSPTTSATLPANRTLHIAGITVIPNTRTQSARQAGGTITVTQDGTLVGRKYVTAGGAWTLKVAPGVYSIVADVVGVSCLGGARIPVTSEGAGTQAICYTAAAR